MKSVLISIRPEWCSFIISGQKTIEVRKTTPKIEPPFKCYIYCSNGKCLHGIERKNIIDDSGISRIVEMPVWLNRKVIGEFVCDRILEVDCDSVAPFDRETKEYIEDKIFFGRDELIKYAGFERTFGWHISNLVIYDKPKELADFWKPGRCPYNKNGCRYPYHCYRSGQIRRCGERLEKPPQSWCYVEELQ